MTGISETDAKSLRTPYPSDFNFTCQNSVVLDHPISVAFPIIAHGGHHFERLTRLGDDCTDFELFHRDGVSAADSTPLAQSRVRTVDPVEPGTEGKPRQFFRLQETISLLFGAIKTKVELVGCQTWDEHDKAALYESVTDQGIMVWKLRELEEFEEDGKKKTKVTETVKGICPSWMRLIVQREADRGHKKHLAKYHTLF